MYLTFSQQAPAQQLTPRQAFFILLIFTIVGLLLLVFWGIPTARHAMESGGWPSGEGNIRISEIARRYDDQDGNVTYSAKVLYAYSVNGMEYLGNTVAFGDYGSSDPAHAGSIVNRYPAGSKVRVYYDPDNPGVSVLESGASWSSFVGIIAGVVFLAIGIFGFVVSLRKIRGTTVAPPESSATFSVR